jgi:hypothetical protein
MTRQNLALPMSILAAGLVLIVLLLTGPNVKSGDLPQGYPTQQNTDPYTNPTVTQTTATTTATSTAQPTNAIATSIATSASQSTATARPTTVAPATATTRPTTPVDLPTVTPTPTLTNAVQCIPGQPVEITGTGTPRAGFLLYFDDRVVSGGSVTANGTFAIRLIVGNERPGAYTITVRERGTSRVLQELNCAVPATTPTAAPMQRFRR